MFAQSPNVLFIKIGNERYSKVMMVNRSLMKVFHKNIHKIHFLIFLLFCLVLEFEHVYLENLPCASMYERSYMHRDVITHVACTK